MKRVDVERGVREMRWPEPTEALRDRVMSSAALVASRVSWSDRVWFSRAWRLTAATAASAVIALASLPDRPDSRTAVASSQAIADARVVEEAGQEVGLSADLALSLSQRTLADARLGGIVREQRQLAVELNGVAGDRR